MTVQEIAPLIVRVVSPRKLLGGVVVRTVGSVLDFFEVYHHVEGVLQASRGLKMPVPHVEMLIGIWESTQWLFLYGISAELDTRCYVQYLP
jgi:hypothetical protein